MKNDNPKALTRRQFLRGAALAAGAIAVPCFIPASALGRGGTVAPSERIVMGGIGLGGRGSYDLGHLLDQRDVQFVAVCDVQKSRRASAKKMVDGKYASNDCAAYIDLRQLLAERTDVDAVLIATGDRWHALASTLAMRAGKDVYCEKPACLTIAQGQMIVEAARRYGRVYQTGAQRLSEPNHVFAIEMARSGPVGTDSHRLCRLSLARWDEKDWLPANRSRRKRNWTGIFGWARVRGGLTTGAI